MARGLTSDFLTHAQAASNRPIVIFEAEFASATLRLWNGYGDLSWNSETWLGNGWFRGIEGGDETTQVEAVDMAVILSGVPSALLALVLGDQKQGAAGSLYIGFIASYNPTTVVADPYLWWKGFYSHAEVEEDPEESTVRLFYDSPLVDLDRPREGRWTHDWQQKLFPGDKGFEYVVAAANWDGTWGAEKNKVVKRKKKNRGSPKKNR